MIVVGPTHLYELKTPINSDYLINPYHVMSPQHDYHIQLQTPNQKVPANTSYDRPTLPYCPNPSRNVNKPTARSSASTTDRPIGQSNPRRRGDAGIKSRQRNDRPITPTRPNTTARQRAAAGPRSSRADRRQPRSTGSKRPHPPRPHLRSSRPSGGEFARPILPAHDHLDADRGETLGSCRTSVFHEALS